MSALKAFFVFPQQMSLFFVYFTLCGTPFVCLTTSCKVPCDFTRNNVDMIKFYVVTFLFIRVIFVLGFIPFKRFALPKKLQSFCLFWEHGGLVLVIDTIQSNPFTQKYNLSCSFHVILQCVRVCL